MATQNDSTFREGQSTTRPPFFDGNDYPYWKTRMRIYLQALDYEIWEVVCDDPFLPLTKNEFGEDIPKPSREWNELEKRKVSLNSKAMNALFCALDKKEFHRVSSCESANEIWHKLKVVYEGTNQVKESKISRYTRQYELFQMEQNESVYSMYTRFTDIVNTLGALGKTFSNSEKVKKIIRSLPKEWRPKRTAIEEAKDLNTLPLDDLIGFLISYEEDLTAEKGHEENKKSIALKASKYESDGESEPDNEELAILARRFRKFFKKTGERRNFINFKNQREKKEVITCYECKKPGHIRSECLLINKLKKKAMVATWDDSHEDSSDEEGSQEVSNLALMAIGGDNNLNEGLKKKKNKWYLDSGCSRHMTGNYAWFSSFTKIENGGDVSFGDNSKGKILGIGNVGKVSSTLIENILFVGNRCGNVYIIDIEYASTLDKYFSALHDDSWLWHRRILLSIAAVLDYKIWQMDVKTAFLNGHLEENIYIQQPDGFIQKGQEHMVCKLQRSIYGLKQASRSWNIRFDQAIKSFGFIQNIDEPCVYKKIQEKSVAFLILYVDDILLIGNDIGVLTTIKSWLAKQFDMKDLGEASYILSIKLLRDRKSKTLALSQAVYINKILARFRMENSKTGLLPFRHGITFSKDQSPKTSKEIERMRQVPYAEAVGSLMYVMLCTRPNVCFAVWMVCRYQFNIGPQYWNAVKHIIKYLKRTKNYMLVYSGDELIPVGYTDSDFMSDKDSRKSISGYVFTLESGAISWRSVKQSSIADSTTEAEYMAASEAAKEAIWLRKFLQDLDVVPAVTAPLKLFCDNSGAVAQSKEPRNHKKQKHIERKYHFIRE
ncbi:hypothetical protein KPL71_008538 [Citrus sinensis]|uniref:Uncharacterized protein n=1 Tax=Citrus sinensis TaxID=2711 RepID=A0ACB8M7H5_CITSI|nr:hypothetical protein KPL71_008538 [Citrus sinensis]